MKRSVDLLAALANGPASADAQRWAGALIDAAAATPAVADVIARAPPPPSGPSLSWKLVTFAGIAVAGAMTAMAIATMNAAPGVTAVIPWWTALVAICPALLVIVASFARGTGASRGDAMGVAARLALALIKVEVPPELALGVAAHLYGLNDQDRDRLAQPPRPPASAPELDHQRIALALAMHATATPPPAKRSALAVLAGVLVLVLFGAFILTYVGVLEGAFLPAVSLPARSAP